MDNVEVIKAKEKIYKADSDLPLRVCAYCRVSTNDNDQKNSLESQKRFFENIFNKHKNWTNVGIFADKGISGTSLEKRDAFNEMIELARRKGVDLIYTKEVSRFSRNVTHLMSIVDELYAKEVYVIFLSDDINTENLEYQERLPQIATNAQAESLKTSRRVRWGQMQQMENGVVFGRKEMYGYNIVRDENGKQRFVIIDEEAEIIKKIFEWYANGYGTHRIARMLKESGVQTKRYKNGWSNTVILRILRNEKYVGDLLQGKTYTPNPLTHKKKYNRNEESAVFRKENHHPESAIISRELWEKVQKKLEENAPSEEARAKHCNRYWTSGKVFCGVCGGRYVHYHKKLKNGKSYMAWICFDSHRNGKAREIKINDEIVNVGCSSKRVNDKVLRFAIRDIITVYIKAHKNQIYDELLTELKKATDKPKKKVKKVNIQEEIEKLESEIISLTRIYNKGDISKFAYDATSKQINEELSVLQKKSLEAEKENDENALQAQLYARYLEEIESLMTLSDEDINDELFERVTQKIVIHPLKILEMHLSFLPHPVIMQYETKGRNDDYDAIFTILSEEEYKAKISNYELKPIKAWE